MSCRLVIGLALALGALPAAAHAERRTSVMVEPIFLVLPMVDATVEYEVTPHIGIAAIAGYGRILLSTSLYDLGGQANIYVKNDFRGWHLGSELRAMWGTSSSPLFSYGKKDNMSTYAEERIMAVYGGYKWLRPSGFTAVVQLGVGRMNMTSASEPPSSRLIPVANLTAGYSW